MKKDKQWLLEKFRKMCYEAKDDKGQFNEGYFLGLNIAIDVTSQLDEPEIITDYDSLIDLISDDLDHMTYSVDDFEDDDTQVISKEDINYILDSIYFPKEHEPEIIVVPNLFDEWYQEIKERWSKEDSAKAKAITNINKIGFNHGLENSVDADLSNDRWSNLRIKIQYNKEKYTRAILDGYKIEQEPMWVVRKFNEQTHIIPYDYFSKFKPYFKEQQPFFWASVHYEQHAHKFTDKTKAEAVATLIDGEVVTYETN